MIFRLLCLCAALACGGAGNEYAGTPDRGAFQVNRVGADQARTILFLGTSLTAGLGVDPEEAYPALIQTKLDSAGFDYQVVNAGVSGETTAGGLSRIDWLLRQPVDVMVLELGANDALRGQDLSDARRNLQEIIDRTRKRYPKSTIILAGMMAPPNLGSTYTENFRRIFEDLARENHLPLIPFLLDGVAGNPGLNQADGIHPTAEGHRIMAQNVWKVLEPLLRSKR